MADLLARSRQGKSALLFGSQLLSPSHETLRYIRSRLLRSDQSVWILETLAELPDWLEQLKDIAQEFYQVAKELLIELNQWLRTDSPLSAQILTSNTILTPLTVIYQLIQYNSYLEMAFSEVQDDRRFSMLRYFAETVGFCTGLLSASAVSCTRNKSSFEEYGSNAIRIAMMCGLVVDAQNHMDDEKAISVATVWHSPEARNRMVEVLERFPGVRQLLHTHTYENRQ